MRKILFVCLGNICRSPMAEFVLKDMVKKAGAEEEFRIDSAGIIDFNRGKPVYRAARLKLAEHGIDCAGKYARQMSKGDYAAYDLLIGMDHANLDDMRLICGGDPERKMRLLMDFTDRPRTIRATLRKPGRMWRKAAGDC